MATQAADGFGRGMRKYLGLSPREAEKARSMMRQSLDSTYARALRQVIDSFEASSRGTTAFLSHSHVDKRVAQALYRFLSQNNVNAWLDEAELRTGDSLIDAISKAITKVDYIVALLSPSAVESKWVRHELRLAMNAEVEGRRIRVLPVAIQPCELPEFLQDKLCLHLWKYARRQDAFSTLLQHLWRHSGTEILW